MERTAFFPRKIWLECQGNMSTLQEYFIYFLMLFTWVISNIHGLDHKHFERRILISEWLPGLERILCVWWLISKWLFDGRERRKGGREVRKKGVGLSVCIFLLYLTLSFRAFFFLFDEGHFWSPYLICYNIASVAIFRFSGHEACGILAPESGIEPASPALEGPGPSGKSHPSGIKDHFLRAPDH